YRRPLTAEIRLRSMCVPRMGFSRSVFGIKILSILLPYLLVDGQALIVTCCVQSCLIFQGICLATGYVLVFTMGSGMQGFEDEFVW
ncbi:MAG: hypothetical protein WBG50_07080, partial [Desulfomonilaceae bacterium]